MTASSRRSPNPKSESDFARHLCRALDCPDDISQATRATLAEAKRLGVPIYVSPITAWEIGIAARKGRFKSPYTPREWLARLMRISGARTAELTAKIMLESSFVPGLNEADPADRIIAATAREYGFTVMTRDRGLLEYGREGYLSVLEC